MTESRLEWGLRVSAVVSIAAVAVWFFVAGLASEARVYNRVAEPAEPVTAWDAMWRDYRAAAWDSLRAKHWRLYSEQQP